MIKINLKEILDEKKMKMNELSRGTGIRQATISAYYNNKAKNISTDNLNKICNFLGCKFNKLVILEEEDESSNDLYETVDLIYPQMIEHFNIVMEMKGSKLRYVLNGQDCGVKQYKLVIEDRFIDNSGMGINLTNEFEEFAREFFRGYGIEFPFRNTIINLWAMKQKRVEKKEED